MERSTLVKVVSEAAHASTLPELKRCVENLALVATHLNEEINALRDPRSTTAAALSAFQDKHKNRVRRSTGA